MKYLYLAVDPDGTEICSNTMLEGFLVGLNRQIEYAHTENYAKGLKMYLKRGDHWCDDMSEGYYCIPRFSGVVLPKGSIEKLTGRMLSWDDEPIKVEI